MTTLSKDLHQVQTLTERLFVNLEIIRQGYGHAYT